MSWNSSSSTAPNRARSDDADLGKRIAIRAASAIWSAVEVPRRRLRYLERSSTGTSAARRPRNAAASFDPGQRWLPAGLDGGCSIRPTPGELLSRGSRLTREIDHGVASIWPCRFIQRPVVGRDHLGRDPPGAALESRRIPATQGHVPDQSRGVGQVEIVGGAAPRSGRPVCRRYNPVNGRGATTRRELGGGLAGEGQAEDLIGDR